jgi:hypothetical protein
MIPVRKKAVIFALAFVTAAPFSLPASSQVIEMVSHDGKTYACQRNSQMGQENFCGTQNFDEIVVGAIVSVDPVSDREIKFSLKPEQVFKGEKAQKIEVSTEQGVCFPDLRPGDHWLLYLVRDKETDALTLAYGSGSGPVMQLKTVVDRLRRLSKFRDSGMILGEVDKSDGTPQIHHPVVARRLPTGARYIVVTNKEGKFEFPPLPAGNYNLNANTIPGMKATWSGEISVEPRQCASYFFDVQVDGRISGSVQNSDGEPVESVEVEALPQGDADNVGGSAVTDEKGHYVINGLDAGRYIVGIGIGDESTGNGGIYAPGVKDRKKALSVNLGQAEKRAGVNIREPQEP